MTDPATPEVICASCGSQASGRFCSNCGASLEPRTCAQCGASLSPGAHFCHNCGASMNAANAPGERVPLPASTPASSALPWIVAAIALITLLAFLAGNAFNRKKGSSLDAPQNALPQAGLDDRGAPADGQGAVRGPDISQLSPQERADRLFNRVMVLNSEGKADSVLFFAPMAIEAYRMLSPMNADQRYDLGRIAEVAGAYPLARAQADTIISESPTHLLGLILAARIADLEKRAADSKNFQSRFLKAYDAELARKLPEYERHEDDIKAALAAARRAGT
ncbi:MAG TPA: zinc ribbon domain-containing protein [Gemmatimonadaceae bacterium]